MNKNRFMGEEKILEILNEQKKDNLDNWCKQDEVNAIDLIENIFAKLVKEFIS